MTRPARRPLLAVRPRGIHDHLKPVDTATYRGQDDDLIDLIAVERVLAGTYDPRNLNRGEAREVALLMARAEHKVAAISTFLCIYERLIYQWMAEEGLLPAHRICKRDGCGNVKTGLGLCNSHLQTWRKQQKRLAQQQMGEAA